MPFQVKNDYRLRTTDGQIILPVMTVERTSVAKDPAFKGGVQANVINEIANPRGYRGGGLPIARTINQEKTRNFANADQNRRSGANKDQQQMNTMLTPFITRTGNINSFIFEENKHRFEAFIQQDFTQNNNLATMAMDERMFLTKIDIKVLGYLIGDGINNPEPQSIIHENIVEIKPIRERTIVGDEKPWRTDNKKYRE